jgi:hypothetical protein
MFMGLPWFVFAYKDATYDSEDCLDGFPVFSDELHCVSFARRLADGFD